MLPMFLTNALHRRPWTRRLTLAAGYVGAVAAIACGGLEFWRGDLDHAMSSGWWMVGGIFLLHLTAEIQTLSRNERRPVTARKPDPIES